VPQASQAQDHRARLTAIARRAMLERGLLPDFSDAARAALATLRARPAQSATLDVGPGVRDLTSLPWCSIDNDDSRDLDQLSVARDSGDGRVTILVAIADVDVLVKEGSAIDDDAHHNTTSVYTAGKVFPMLP